MFFDFDSITKDFPQELIGNQEQRIKNEHDFNDYLSHRVNHSSGKLAKIQESFKTAPVLHLAYEVKWQAEDLVTETRILRELNNLQESIDKCTDPAIEHDVKWDAGDMAQNVTEWLQGQMKKFIEQLQSLSINNSGGMYHNADSFFELKGVSELVKMYQEFISILTHVPK